MASSSEHIRKSFMPLAAHACRQWRRAIDRELEPLGLSEATWLALIHLVRAPEPLRQKDLAAAMALDSSSVVRLLDALESAGYIERVECADRRAKAIHLTAHGNTIARQVDKVVGEARKRLLGDIPDTELETAFRVLRQISAVLSGVLEQPS